jgi:hypothetical protein
LGEEIFKDERLRKGDLGKSFREEKFKDGWFRKKSCGRMV